MKTTIIIFLGAFFLSCEKSNDEEIYMERSPEATLDVYHDGEGQDYRDAFLYIKSGGVFTKHQFTMFFNVYWEPLPIYIDKKILGNKTIFYLSYSKNPNANEKWEVTAYDNGDVEVYEQYFSFDYENYHIHKNTTYYKNGIQVDYVHEKELTKISRIYIDKNHPVKRELRFETKNNFGYS